jgi:hypothetical protein
MARGDLLSGSPRGRQFLAGYLGSGHGHALFERLGPGQVPGPAPLTAGGIRPRALRRHRRRQDVAPHQARAVISAAEAREEWRGLLDLDEAGPLADLAGGTLCFGFSGDGEAMWALTALAAQELRPVADALVSSPAARRWWQPGTRGSAGSWNRRLAAAGRAGRGAVRPLPGAARDAAGGQLGLSSGASDQSGCLPEFSSSRSF